MPYSDFTLDAAVRTLGVTVAEADLFPGLVPAAVPDWLPGLLARGTRLALISEKARSEFIVAPLLLAARELTGDRLAIFSGQRLDQDAARGLTGECDFLLTLGPSVPPLQAPLVAVVEAKKNDIEGGLGQCTAQMVAARGVQRRRRPAGPADVRVRHDRGGVAVPPPDGGRGRSARPPVLPGQPARHPGRRPGRRRRRVLIPQAALPRV